MYIKREIPISIFQIRFQIAQYIPSGNGQPGGGISIDAYPHNYYHYGEDNVDVRVIHDTTLKTVYRYLTKIRVDTLDSYQEDQRRITALSNSLVGCDTSLTASQNDNKLKSQQISSLKFKIWSISIIAVLLLGLSGYIIFKKKTLPI